MIIQDSFTMRALSKAPALICPYHNEGIEGIIWDDGDTVDATSLPYIHSSLMWGNCAGCGHKLYLLDVAILPQITERQFMNDFAWEAKKRRVFEARGRAFAQPWYVAEYKDVSGITVYGQDNKQNIIEAPWLDLHSFAPLSAPNKAAAFDMADLFTRALLNYLGHQR